jgi:hypothetical protein
MKKILPVALLLFIIISNSRAGIDLVTVPATDYVQLTIYNSADITMVRDKRTLTFKKGLNRLQFSWAGTLIDPTSLRMTFKDKKEGLELLDVTYPPGRNDALQWNIQSDIEGPAAVEIMYFTSGITWQADYVLNTNDNETKMDVTGNVTVVNNSGEDYPNAEIRLVVGTIHLVENIRDLAQGSTIKYKDLDDNKRDYARKKYSKSISRAEEYEKDSVPSNGASYKPKEIIKEGLSEYFLFSIEGKETVLNSWRKRLKSIRAENVPVQVIYKLSDISTGGQVHKFYEFWNKKVTGAQGTSELGDTPLPDGRVQIFSIDSKGNLSYKGAVNTSYIAAGDKVKLDIGINKDIEIERLMKDYKRKDIVYEKQAYSSNFYVKKYVTQYNYETTIKNTIPYPVKIEIERSFSGDFKVLNMNFIVDKVSKRAFKYYPELNANEKKVFKYQIDENSSY